MALIEPTLTYDDFDEADIVVEAVFEGMELKKKVFAELDQVCPARRHPGLQHVDAGHRRDRLGHVAAAAGDRPSLFQPGQRDAAARDRARQADQPRGHRHVDGAGQEARQGRRAGRQLPRLRRQPHVRRLSARGPVPAGRGRARRGSRRGAGRVRHGDGARWPSATWPVSTSAGGFARNTSTSIPPGTRQPLVADRLCELGRYGQKTGAGLVSLRGGEPQPAARP